MYVAKGVLKLGIRSSTVIMSRRFGVEGGVWELCAKKERGNEGMGMKGQTKGGGMGAGVAVGGSVCGCCAALVLLGGSEVWLFSGMGGGEGCRSRERVVWVAVEAVVAVMVGRDGWSSARSDTSGRRGPDETREATRFVFEKKRRWRGLHEHEHEHEHEHKQQEHILLLPSGCSPLGRHARQGRTGADRVDTPTRPAPPTVRRGGAVDEIPACACEVSFIIQDRSSR
jgi:hypothetical protein